MSVKLQKLISTFLMIYPSHLQSLLRGTVFISSQERFRGNDRIEGSYDVETGEIILWNPRRIKEDDLFVIVTHEWGHKIYHEWLSDKDRAGWLSIRSVETIDFGLDKSYPSLKLPEEEFCTVFCLLSRKLYLEKEGMETRAKKLSAKMKSEFPQAVTVVERYLMKEKRDQRGVKRTSHHDITHREVETIKAWIRGALKD